MTGAAILRRLGRDEKGATLIEFAMILPALSVLLMAIFDLGYRSYAASVVQGALHDAARMATVGGITGTQIDARVRTRLSHFARYGTVGIRTQSYFEYSNVGLPERITSDTVPLNVYNSTDCFEDTNGNGVFDTDRGRSGTGGADDVVQYEVTLTYQRMFPVASLLGWGDTETIRASTMLRNQPFAGRNLNAPEVCPT